MSVFALSERIVEKVSSTGISMFATRNFQCIEVKKRYLAQGVTLDTLLLLMLERRVLRSWKKITSLQLCLRESYEFEKYGIVTLVHEIAVV